MARLARLVVAVFVAVRHRLWRSDGEAQRSQSQVRLLSPRTVPDLHAVGHQKRSSASEGKRHHVGLLDGQLALLIANNNKCRYTYYL